MAVSIEMENLKIFETFNRAKIILGTHKKICVSISGGSDSDIIMDIVEKTKTPDNYVEYVFCDTGLEYEATKRHLDYLENKYGIKITRLKAEKPIPLCVKEYGVPFLSKDISQKIEAFQKKGFDFKDEPYEKLLAKYNKFVSSIGWWCNRKQGVVYNICRHRGLKEFLVDNKIPFNVSAKCCTYSKKLPIKKYLKENHFDLEVIGVRKAEGGIRATSYSNCFSESKDGIDQYRPIFFWTNGDKKEYEKANDIVHSDCYTKYGLKRTGCVGCPFNRNLLSDLEAIKEFEPKLYKACMKVFGASYEFTKKYREYAAMMKKQEKNKGQLFLKDETT